MVPYHSHVPHDPSVEEMKMVVVLREIRPEVEERWNRNEVMASALNTISLCAGNIKVNWINLCLTDQQLWSISHTWVIYIYLC